MPQLELHPLCTLFPRLNDAEFACLSADIEANGLRQPIVTHDGMILDGGNRYRACLAAGVEPTFVEFSGGNIVSFVLSANLHRRHLSAGQQAAIVASAQDWAQAQPANRPGKGCNVAPLSTVADRAAQSGASNRTQKMADKVARAAPDLAKKVAHGEISLPQAHKQVAPASAKAHPADSVEALKREVAELRERLEEAEDGARELAHLLEAYGVIGEGEEAVAREIVKIKAQLRTVEIQRDSALTTCNELKREVKALRRKVAA
jgi:HAMP domain-containing protein